MSKLHKTFESFLMQENTRENLPKRSLQSVFFAVHCICQKNAARAEQGETPRSHGVLRREITMLEMLPGTITHPGVRAQQGRRVSFCIPCAGADAQ